MRLLIFAGTSEGRALCESLSFRGVAATAWVATEYGKLSMEAMPHITVRAGRLEASEMAEIFKDFDTVVDATHPYAKAASENILKASRETGAQYLRLIRPTNGGAAACVSVDSTAAAAEYLCSVEGNALITTGSRDIDAFLAVPDYSRRLFLRVLPDPDVVRKCAEKGFAGKRLICMQGPFTHEMNVALLKMTGAKFLVTKDTGESGGFYEKLSAAREVGAEVVLISRPGTEIGYTLEKMQELLAGEKLNCRADSGKFPLFVDLAGKTCVVIGAGNVGSRRINVLLSFGAHVKVIDPRTIKKDTNASYITREYVRGDCRGAFLAVAATDSREINHAVAMECADAGIPVSVADCQEECSFFFPAICRNKKLAAGLVSDGTDHQMTANIAEKIRKLMEECQA